MSSSKYKQVFPERSLVPGYHSLLLHIKFHNSPQYMRFALTSTTSPYKAPSTESILTIDLEPASQESLWLFYKWSDTSYASFSTLLVKPKEFPSQGKILIGPEASQHGFRAELNVGEYFLVSVAPGPLGHLVR
ncbi:TPA_asm: matrix protein [electric eel bornavirus]|uniref:Matrix protein n=1 Tax=electric eel bornavirus TaxID=3055757 RepID=A0AA48P908_9MONO|nr:TPA_asm: matrix protein [electric eel bornavirus]